MELFSADSFHLNDEGFVQPLNKFGQDPLRLGRAVKLGINRTHHSRKALPDPHIMRGIPLVPSDLQLLPFDVALWDANSARRARS